MEGASNPAKGQNLKSSDGSMSPATYQVNVNRTKTRKWVEAKVQNYDGDDWGADEFEEEDEESSPEPQRSATSQQPLGDRLPSQTPSATAGPAQTTSLDEKHEKSELGEAPTTSNENTAEQGIPLASIPEVPSASGAPESQSSEHQPPRVDTAPSFATDESKAHIDTSGPDVDGGKQASANSYLPDVSRASVLGADPLAGGKAPSVAAEVEQAAQTEHNTKPLSLPRDEPAETQLGGVSEVSVSQRSASLAGGQETENSSNQDEDIKGLNLTATSSRQNKDYLPDSQKTLLPGAHPSDLPPLRTPSPRGGQITSPPTQPWTVEEPTSDVTPTEPLQPRAAAAGPPDIEHPIVREPTFETNSSSPVKESDTLSQEIMRSLSPGGLLPTPAKTGPEATRDGVDEVDNDPNSNTGAGPEQALQPSAQEAAVAPIVATPITAQQPEQAPESSVQEAVIPESANTRRRFSWEAEKEAQAMPAHVTSSVPSHPALSSATAPSAPSETDSVSKPSESETVSRQVSKTSTVQPSRNQSLAESSSPVSLMSSAAPQQSHPDTTQTLTLMSPPPLPAEQEESTTTVVTHTPVIQVPEHQVKPPSIATFKEIMGSQSSQERIRKFDETREVFASMNSGLDDWLATLKLQHPEHAHATSSFHEGANQGPPPGAPAFANTGLPNQPAQQPYYQQWMNANQSSATNSSLRTRIAGSVPQGSGGSSSFGSSGDRIGTKSKELMQSAGKMGKGLLNKGRSKLRGTGDKVFH